MKTNIQKNHKIAKGISKKAKNVQKAKSGKPQKSLKVPFKSMNQRNMETKMEEEKTSLGGDQSVIEKILKKINNKDELNNNEIQFLEVFLRNKSKYGLNWIDVPEIKKINDQEFEINKFLKNHKPFLKLDSSLSIDGDGNNLLIEGDNYEALHALIPIYRGLIDVVYIDPPYNTGNKDFLYNDNYVGLEDQDKHSRWISFMEKRLRLAFELMCADSIIAIQIDDRELFNLKLLCDKIFGESGLVNNVSVKMNNLSGKKMTHIDKGNKFPKLKESILIYKKGNPQLVIPRFKKSEDLSSLANYIKYYSSYIENFHEEKDPTKWIIKNLRDEVKKNPSSFGISGNESKEECSLLLNQWKVKNAERVIYRTNNKVVSDFWTMNNPVNSVNPVVSPTGLIYIGWDGKEMLFLSENLESYYGDMWDDITTINLNKETPVGNFSNGQKPLKLLERIINLSKKDKLMVLDFFGGSASTGHACMINKVKDINVIVCTDNSIPDSNNLLFLKEVYGYRESDLVSFLKSNSKGVDFEKDANTKLVSAISKNTLLKYLLKQEKIFDPIKYQSYGICRYYAQRRLAHVGRDNKKSLRYFNIKYFEKEKTDTKTKQNLSNVILNLLKVKEGLYLDRAIGKYITIISNGVDEVVYISDIYKISDTDLKNIASKYKGSKFYINADVGVPASIQKILNGLVYEIIPDEFYNTYQLLEGIK